LIYGFRKPKILCPSCKTGKLPSNLSTVNEVQCTACRVKYPVQNGVLDLLPELSHKRTVVQMLLDWKPLIKIYEGRLWRKGYLFPALLGISFERESELIMKAASLTGDEVLLDLACGPGIHSRRFAQMMGSGVVAGLDISLPMLNHASLQTRKEAIDNLILIHGDASSLPFPAKEFDVVNCCGAIHLFPALSRVLSEITRILKPGGCFITFTFRKGTGKFSQYLARLCQGVSGVRSFHQDELELYLREAGLQDVECHHNEGIGLLMSATRPL
jgi:ubiquinone/menaquinone biosynthesis C-methylase UbiE